MKLDFNLLAKVLVLFWPYIQKAVDKIKNSTTVDEKMKELFISFSDYGEKVLVQTMEALFNAEETNDTVTKGIMFKFARILKVFVLKAQNLIDRIEIEFGEIDLEPEKY